MSRTFTPLENDYLLRTSDPNQTYREISRHSIKDAETYMRFGPRMGQIGMAVPPKLSKIIFSSILKIFAGIKYDHVEPNIQI